MVKTPKVRHSKSRREPVTIELGPDEVTRVEQETAAPQASGVETVAEDPAIHADSEPVEEEAIRTPDADFEPWEHGKAAAEAGAAQDMEATPTADRQPAPEASAPDDGPAEAGSHGDYQYNFDEPPKSPSPGPAAVAEPSPRRGGLALLAAGIVGGAIALAGAGALQYAGLIGNGGARDDLESQISALKGQLGSIDLGSLNNATAKVGELSTALDQTRQDLAALKDTVGQGADQSLVAGLDDRLKQVEAAVAALGQDGSGASADLGAVNDKLATLEASVKSAGDAVAQQDQRLSALENSLADLGKKVDAQASQPKVALAIAASALKAALDRGGPFSAELDTFAAVSPGSPQVAALRAYADKGLPTRQEIAAEADAAAGAMIAAATPADPNAGFFQSLLSSAESLVKVRPIGAVQGKGVPETVARMVAAVNQGDYKKALAEYGSLPDAVKAAGADFAARLKARLDAEAQVDALVSGAMKS